MATLEATALTQLKLVRDEERNWVSKPGGDGKNVSWEAPARVVEDKRRTKKKNTDAEQLVPNERDPHTQINWRTESVVCLNPTGTKAWIQEIQHQNRTTRVNETKKKRLSSRGDATLSAPPDNDPAHAAWAWSAHHNFRGGQGNHLQQSKDGTPIPVSHGKKNEARTRPVWSRRTCSLH